MLNIRLLAIGLIVVVTCSSFIYKKPNTKETSQQIELKPNEEFIFGEFTFERAKFKVFNSSTEELQIKILDQESMEPQTILPFESQTSFTAHIFPWEKVLIQNPSDVKVSIKVDSKKLDSGFRIQEMQIHAR